MIGQYPSTKEIIVGGGIIGALEAYFAYVDASKKGEKIRITIHERNKNIAQTTASNIAPSLTPDEILSVVPPGPVLAQKLEILFSQPGGIRVDDVKGVNDSKAAYDFINQVHEYSKDKEGHEKRTKLLLEMGKFSMDLWQHIYDNADKKLKEILEESNFNPCKEPLQDKDIPLHDGYRIDLIYGIKDATIKAQGMKSDYESLGYSKCKLLTPGEVKALDPFLREFCDIHSKSGVWENDAVALFRPGGCIDTQVFLPKFYAYLKEVMGQYINDKKEHKDCFRLKFESELTEVLYDENETNPIVTGLRFANKIATQHHHQYDKSDYVICTGENVGILGKLKLQEPAYAGFAGASLKLNISIPENLLEHFSKLNHCMEVHREGVVLAWQARMIGNEIFIAVAGTKAFYGDQKPHKDQDFAKNRNLLQLNMINDVLPECISLALQRDTKGQMLSEHDLVLLEEKNIARRWVGTRAVAYDGFPTLGEVYHANGAFSNLRCTKDLSSGGVSFGPAAVLFSRSVKKEKPFLELKPRIDELRQEVMKYAKSNRK